MKLLHNGKRVCPVFDLHYGPSISRHDFEEVGKELDIVKAQGFDRIYCVIIPPGLPMISNPMLYPADTARLTGNTILESAMALGDINFAYAYEAHKRGIEAIAIYKPYEGGGGFTIPHGAKASFAYGRREDIGGDRIGFESFVAQHPEYVTRRRPDESEFVNANQTVTALSVSFCLDAVREQAHKRGQFLDHPAIEPGDVSEKPAHIKLYVSKDNGDYSPWEEPCDRADYITSEDIFDPNGKPVLQNARVRRLELRNLHIPAEYQYIAFTVDCPHALLTLPYTMIRAYGDKGLIPACVSPHIRRRNSLDDLAVVNASDRVWGAEEMPILWNGSAQTGADMFMHNGFEFEWHGQGFFGDGFKDNTVYCIGKGKMQHLKGNLCEGYREVRSHWLEVIDRLLAMGYDGIDLRLQAHSSMITDYTEYGYNPPIVKRYSEEYGVDILKEKADPIKLMRVRGLFYEEFVAQAASLIHSKGKLLSVHVRHCFEEPKLSANFNELGFWVMPKILPDYKKLIDAADEVVLKDYFFNDYSADIAKQMKTYAKAQNKRFFINLYIAQGGEMNDTFWDAVCEDELVGGICLYEVAQPERIFPNGQPHEPGMISQRNGIRRFEPTMQKVDELLLKYGFEERK